MMFFRTSSIMTCIFILVLESCTNIILAAGGVGIFPDEELLGSQEPLGEITPIGFRAIRASIPELAKYKVAIDDYKSIIVHKAGSSIHVYFSLGEINSHATGSPDGPPVGIIVRIDGNTFYVLGSDTDQ